MKAEEFCRQRYPRAYVSRQRDRSGRAYYLIYEDRLAGMYMVHEGTKAKAWTALKRRIEAQGEVGRDT